MTVTLRLRSTPATRALQRIEWNEDLQRITRCALLVVRAQPRAVGVQQRRVAHGTCYATITPYRILEARSPLRLAILSIWVCTIYVIDKIVSDRLIQIRLHSPQTNTSRISLIPLPSRSSYVQAQSSPLPYLTSKQSDKRLCTTTITNSSMQA